jgi:tetratricopeptide (TPR) repeat protein
MAGVEHDRAAAGAVSEAGAGTVGEGEAKGARAGAVVPGAAALGEAALGEADLRGAAARLDRWRAEVAGARLLLAERRTAGDWKAARQAASRLGELDPLDAAVPAALAALDLEDRAAASEARAREQEALGRDEEALALYTAIPRGSWHHGRARDASARLIRERLAPARRAECVRLLARGARARALPVCRRYLDLTCHEAIDASVAAVVRRARPAPGEAPWSCPGELGAWLASGDGGRGDGGTERAVRKRYPDPAIAEALLAHLRDGRTRAAREALDRLGARALAGRLEELDGRLVEARARLLAGDIDAAGQALERAAAIEDELQPGGPASPALAGARAAVATALRERADEHRARGRDGLAFTALRQALALAPGEVGILRALEELEAHAGARLDGDSSCDAAALALSATAPGGPVHRRAEERLAAPPCNGVGGF